MRKIRVQKDLPKRCTECFQCHKCLNPGDEIASCLVLTDDTYIRKDYCTECSLTIDMRVADDETGSLDSKKELSQGGAVFWKGKIPHKEKRNEWNKKSRNDKAYVLFKEELEKNSEESNKIAFVLAYYLLREKILTYRREVQHLELGLCILFEDQSLGEPFLVPKQTLSELKIKNIQAEIASQLS